MGGFRKELTAMEIYVKPFKKKFNIKTSNKIVRTAMKLQYSFAKMNNTSDKTPEEVYKAQIDAIDDALAFMTDTLKLNKKQRSDLEDMDFTETISTIGYICDRLMGLNDEQIKEETEKVRDDPKK